MDEIDVLSTENVKNLLKRPVTPPPKTPLYLSKHRPMVKNEVERVKDCHRTMGLPSSKTPVDEFKNYLRKNSSAQRREANRVKGSNPYGSHLKGPTITKCSKPTPKSAKDFVKENKAQSKRIYPQYGSLKQVDSSNGDYAQHVGLRPHYIYYKNYGKVPKYLEKQKKLKEKIDKMTEEEVPKEELSYRILSEEERQDILEKLTKNLKALQIEHQSLPVLCDTIPQIQRKSRIEKKLNELEKEIYTIESNKYIYIEKD